MCGWFCRGQGLFGGKKKDFRSREGAHQELLVLGFEYDFHPKFTSLMLSGLKSNVNNTGFAKIIVFPSPSDEEKFLLPSDAP